jgi:tetratricopeptide (TPR) repeat protein
LAKGSAVPLPLALVVLDIYPLKRLQLDPRTWLGPQTRDVLLEKIPFLFVAVPFAIVAVLAKQSTGAVASAANITLLARAMQSFYGLAFYLWKTILPLALSPLYPRPIRFDPWAWPFVLSGVVVLVISVLLIVASRRRPAGLAAWVYYVVILLPLVGVVTYGPQIVADRYSYFACLSWAILAGSGMLYLWKLRAARNVGEPVFALLNGLAGLVLIVLAVISWKQTQIWHDSERLWKHALALDDKSSFAHNNLGLALAKRNALDEAINELRRAVEFDPAFVEAYTNLGNFLAQRGARNEAIVHLRRALQIDPAFANAHNTLGNVLADTGALNEAIEHFHKALQIDPHSAGTHYNLARVLAKRGDQEEAIAQYRAALEIDPGDVDVHNNLGLLFLSRGDSGAAIEQFNQAIRVDPTYSKAYFNLGKLYAQQDRLDEAVVNFQKALQIQPGVAEIHENLGRVFARQGKRTEALREYQEALRLLQTRSQGGGS